MSESVDIALEERGPGDVVLRCTRADGSTTWQRHRGHQARFFPLHDLVHLAVESTLGARDGFWGLVAAGWEIEETTGKGARGPLPDETVVVEQLVNLFSLERTGGATPPDAAGFRAVMREVMSAGAPWPWTPRIDDAALAATRAAIDALHDRWARTPTGATLALRFERPALGRLARQDP